MWGWLRSCPKHVRSPKNHTFYMTLIPYSRCTSHTVVDCEKRPFLSDFFGRVWYPLLTFKFPPGQLLTKYQIFTKLPQISRIHKNNISKVKLKLFYCFFPLNFMAGTSFFFFFSFLPVLFCEPLSSKSCISFVLRCSSWIEYTAVIAYAVLVYSDLFNSVLAG